MPSTHSAYHEKNEKVQLRSTQVERARRAARVFGTVFDEDIQPARSAVQINTTPQQQIITTDGAYSFDVTAGTYRLAAVGANASAEKNVTIQADGQFRIDLILLPGVPEEDEALADLLDVADVTPPADNGQAPADLTPWAIGGAILLAAAIGYSQRHRFRKAGKKPAVQAPAPSQPAASVSSRVLTADQHKVMQTLDSFGNRAAQKDLRKALSQWSEAKVSMELTELEELGIIHKLKKGRGNVIRKA